jgi:hypothetical protein
MAISEIRFVDGVFYCKESGTLTEDDAQLWATKAREFTRRHDAPVIALIDARDLKQVTRPARRILAEATAISDLKLAAVVTQNFTARKAADTIDNSASDPHTITFQKMAEARRFVENKARQLQANA